jgi:hypothetical protein
MQKHGAAEAATKVAERRLLRYKVGMMNQNPPVWLCQNWVDRVHKEPITLSL